MTQLADASLNNTRFSKGMNLQFGFAGLSRQSPAFLKIGRGPDFSAEIFGLALGTEVRAPTLGGIFGGPTNSPSLLNRLLDRFRDGIPCLYQVCAD